jgi:hypothetical protein
MHGFAALKNNYVGANNLQIKTKKKTKACIQKVSMTARARIREEGTNKNRALKLVQKIALEIILSFSDSVFQRLKFHCTRVG